MGEVIPLFPRRKECECGWLLPVDLGYDANVSIKDRTGQEVASLFKSGIDVTLSLSFSCPECNAAIKIWGFEFEDPEKT